MTSSFKKACSFFCIALLVTSAAKAQDETDENGDPIVINNKKGLHVGIYIGSLFANKSTAPLYDGYGFDMDGNRNSFENSFMYNKIINEYGGGYGNPDQIATALGVQHGEWTFNESDMPVNMKYAPAFLLGLQGRYSVDKSNAILLNVNASQLNITGNFTITTLPPTNSTQINQAIKTCAIKGVEKRVMFQVGYQRLLGESQKVNLFAEAGLNITMAKFDKNEIMVGSLLIDLTSYYYQPGLSTYFVRKPLGIGYGAFGGLGVNFNMNENFRVQFLYSPTYEKINLGADARLHFQHAVGIRVYYSFK